MPAYAVKHIAEDHGALASLMKDVRKAPYSYASNEPEATQAALGNDVYVFEVRSTSKSSRSFWLGYKYRAYEKYPPAGGGLWGGRFKFKNAARPIDRAEGAYFASPVEVTDPGVNEWLREKQPGMVEIPAHLLGALEALLRDPALGALPYR